MSIFYFTFPGVVADLQARAVHSAIEEKLREKFAKERREKIA